MREIDLRMPLRERGQRLHIAKARADHHIAAIRDELLRRTLDARRIAVRHDGALHLLRAQLEILHHIADAEIMRVAVAAADRGIRDVEHADLEIVLRDQRMLLRIGHPLLRHAIIRLAAASGETDKEYRQQERP